MFASLADKKKFLQWLVATVPFSRREILWILNYLLRHEVILNKVHFVERVEKTTRGIRIAAEGMADEPITLFLSGKAFEDTEQIFHEIRMNWKEILYLECIFPEAWSTSEYLAILEDNPFAPWNEQVDPEVAAAVEAYFKQEEQGQQISLLHQQIDQALEASDYDAFLELSSELNRLKSR